MRTGPDTVIVDSGNPIEPPPAQRPERGASRARWGLPAQGGRVLLVFGGSQGAVAINETVAAWLSSGKLPDGLQVIWATGKGSYEKYRGHQSDCVSVHAYLSPMSEAYAATDLAIARAGAMGTAEMCAWGIPAILVPLPTAAADHQTANARALADAGAAVMLPQSQLSVDVLDQTVRSLLADDRHFSSLAAGAIARGRPEAAETIARRIATIVGDPP
jgi:UDP-N-acetylglucosamine--N-acetylmuramyl-(pentapeptide) pyrophosphoryl-undecaprenol N-acetylglucosamine transferase